MRPTLLALFALAACAGHTPSPSLVWHDEFDGPAGASFDRAKWVADTGGQGFGNQEREFYTTRAENVALDGDGHLVITARVAPSSPAHQCWYGACRYTSTRLKTKGLFAQTYGRFEARIRIPRGQGMWPAFWMLGADIDSIGDDFHVFAVTWQPNEIRWYVDGREYHHMTPADLPHGTKWVFDHPFFLLLNLAVGGGWPGDPDASTTFPQQMVVDYIRVYRDPQSTDSRP